MAKILKQEDILKIATFLNENGYSDEGIAVINYVEDQEILNKINEDFFYRSEHEDNMAFDNKCDGVDIECDGVAFKFRIKEENENSQE